MRDAVLEMRRQGSDEALIRQTEGERLHGGSFLFSRIANLHMIVLNVFH